MSFLCTVVAAFCEAGEGNLPYRASSFAPVPNYGLTTDSPTGDLAQLTDRRMNRWPFWSSKDSVGWQRRTPVLIELARSEPGEASPQGLLRLNVARKTRAGVEIPQRIDVYGSRNGGIGWVHVGQATFQPTDFADGAAHWLEIPVSRAATRLAAVVHVRGEFLFVDEVEFRIDAEPGSAVPTEEPVKGLNEAALLTDSVGRLKQAALEESPAPGQGAMPMPGGNGRLLVFPCDPWNALPAIPARDVLAAAASRSDVPVIPIRGARNEQESACLGLYNVGPDAMRVVVRLSGSDTPAMAVAEVQRIVAGNGSAVYDPLLPVADGGELNLPDGSVAYLWLTVDLARIAGPHARLGLVLDAGDMQVSQAVDVTVLPFDIRIREVSANAWGYARDIPIWTDPDAAVRDQRVHGINVFVVHPSYVPQPRPDKPPSALDFHRLSQAVGRLGPDAFLLLYLQWEAVPSAPEVKWLAGASDIRSRTLDAWLKALHRTMESLSIPADRWALYPVDEYTGSDREFMRSVLADIKRLSPGTGIYQNPVDIPAQPTSIADLEVIAPYVDYWQPEITFALGKGRAFFESLDRPWWIYANVGSPAKVAPPIHFRAMGWRAAALGASGLGFWSYSSTAGSAWDDFDSTSPDWAVVYEGSPIVSSRRWEGFREGLEDLALAKQAGLTPVLPPVLADWAGSGPDASVAVQTLRTRALSALAGGR